MAEVQPGQDKNEENRNISTQIPHSGIHGDEFPVTEFDKTPLVDAVGQGMLTTPDSPESLPTLTWPERTEKKGFTKIQKLAAVGAGTLLAAGIGAGLMKATSGNSEHKGSVGPVATAEATPTPTATTPEATPSPTETAAPTAGPEAAALVAAYESLPIGEFNALPREQRLKVVWNTYNTLATEGELGDFMLAKPPGDGRVIADYNPAHISPNTADNGQLIAGQYLFASQAAAARKKDMATFGEGPLDFNRAQQLISGVTYEVGAKDRSTDYSTIVSTMKENVNAAKLIGSEHFLALDTSVLKKGVDAEGQPIDYKEVLLNPGTGRTHKMQFNFTTFRGADGQEHSLWLEASDKYATSL